MSASPVVLRRATVGYIDCKPAGSFYEARSAAPDIVIGAYASRHEARKAIFEERRARQAALRRKEASRCPPGAKPIYRGERMIGWVATGERALDAVLAASGEVLGPFPTEADARRAINSAWGKTCSKLAPVYGLAARRRGDLVRLARHRRERGQDIHARAMAMAMADALVFSLTGADYAAMLELGRAGNIVDVRPDEDDISSADNPGRTATLKHLNSVGAPGAGVLAEDDMVSAVLKVSAVAKARGRRYRPFAPLAVARMLGVTLAEKLELKLHTIAAIDETREQAAERRRAQRREYERERNKRRRIERGAVPREQSLSRVQPWTATGVSRSTWYARQKADQGGDKKGVAALRTPGGELFHKGKSSEKAGSSKPEATVGQIRPPTTQGRGFAVAAVGTVQHGPRRDGLATRGQGDDCCGQIIELRRGSAPSPSQPIPSATNAGRDRCTRLAADAPPCVRPDPAPRKLVTDADLKRLREIANRVRWESGLAKLSASEIVRLLGAAPSAGPVIDVDGQDDSEDAADDQEAEWLSGRYDRMDDQLLLDQLGREEAPTSLVDDLAELLDWSEAPRRQLIRSRLIDWLVDRDLAA